MCAWVRSGSIRSGLVMSVGIRLVSVRFGMEFFIELLLAFLKSVDLTQIIIIVVGWSFYKELDKKIGKINKKIDDLLEK